MDKSGDVISDDQEGLLLYGGGTVCDDNFSDKSADAICGRLGENFRAVSWRSGFIYSNLQTSKKVKMTDVECSSHHWASCSSSTSQITCRHVEDVHLACKLGK